MTPASAARPAAETAGYSRAKMLKSESKASAAAPITTSKTLATAGQTAASSTLVPKVPAGAVKPGIVATAAALPGPSGLHSKASITFPSDGCMAAYGPGPSGAQAYVTTPKDPARGFRIPAGLTGPAGETRGVGPSPQPSREHLGAGRMPSVRFDTATVMYEGADAAQLTSTGSSLAVGAQQPPKKRSRIKRPPELPYLRLPKFTLAPLRIIGLLRPRASHPRKQPTLRELLRETQIKEQDRLNLDTKERERQLTLVVVVLVLFLYFLGMAGSAYYFELTDITAATPDGRRLPIDILRSTINGSGF